MKRIEVACGVVLNDKGQYLIAQRGDGKHNGKWEFAGGKLKDDETSFDAIIRDVIKKMLKICDNDIYAVAKILKIEKEDLLNIISRYDI